MNIQGVTNDAGAAEALQRPTIIDLGKKSRKRVKKLRKGRPGGLMSKVQEVIEQLRQAGSVPAAAHTVVVIVRERSRRGRATKMWGFG
ncbi:hypothetical protein WME73_13220 [Sorangium sp. So ce302]|uniref:DUF6200 domain-containing protein n=1 Tax=unclassified Sorangium TaxID=2621164 RepID=UPI003F6336D4